MIAESDKRELQCEQVTPIFWMQLDGHNMQQLILIELALVTVQIERNFTVLCSHSNFRKQYQRSRNTFTYGRRAIKERWILLWDDERRKKSPKEFLFRLINWTCSINFSLSLHKPNFITSLFLCALINASCYGSSCTLSCTMSNTQIYY